MCVNGNTYDQGVGVRRAGFGDEIELRAVRLRALKDVPDAFSADYEKNEARTPVEWRAWFSPGATFCFEITLGDTVGMVAVIRVEDEPDVRQLAAMWVSPSVCGSGVGDSLVQALLSWCRTGGALIARVQVYDFNDAAHPCTSATDSPRPVAGYLPMRLAGRDRNGAEHL